MAGLTDPKMMVDDWSKLADMDKMADCVFITVQDRLHKDPAIAFAKKGYNVLLEKPMSVDETECEEIAKAKSLILSEKCQF